MEVRKKVSDEVAMGPRRFMWQYIFVHACVYKMPRNLHFDFGTIIKKNSDVAGNCVCHYDGPRNFFGIIKKKIPCCIQFNLKILHIVYKFSST